MKPGKHVAIPLSDRTIGLRTKYRGKKVLAVRDETILKIAGSRPVAKTVIQKLQQEKILVGGHGGRRTTQLPVRISVNKKMIKKPRFWLIDVQRLHQREKTFSRGK